MPPPANQSRQEPPCGSPPPRQPRAKIPNGTSLGSPPSPSAEFSEPALCEKKKSAFSPGCRLRSWRPAVQVLPHSKPKSLARQKGRKFRARSGRAAAWAGRAAEGSRVRALRPLARSLWRQNSERGRA